MISLDGDISVELSGSSGDFLGIYFGLEYDIDKILYSSSNIVVFGDSERKKTFSVRNCIFPPFIFGSVTIIKLHVYARDIVINDNTVYVRISDAITLNIITCPN